MRREQEQQLLSVSSWPAQFTVGCETITKIILLKKQKKHCRECNMFGVKVTIITMFDVLYL